MFPGGSARTRHPSQRLGNSQIACATMSQQLTQCAVENMSQCKTRNARKGSRGLSPVVIPKSQESSTHLPIRVDTMFSFCSSINSIIYCGTVGGCDTKCDVDGAAAKRTTTEIRHGGVEPLQDVDARQHA